MTDRIIRTVLGTVLLVLAVLVLGGLWQALAGIVGAVLMVTGLTGVCPAYRLLGMSTCPPPSESR
jgi:hypothetical protein